MLYLSFVAGLGARPPENRSGHYQAEGEIGTTGPSFAFG
jgi:hypothetical protein